MKNLETIHKLLKQELNLEGKTLDEVIAIQGEPSRFEKVKNTITLFYGADIEIVCIKDNLGKWGFSHITQW